MHLQYFKLIFWPAQVEGCFHKCFHLKPKCILELLQNFSFIRDDTNLPFSCTIFPHTLANKRMSNRPSYPRATNGWPLSVPFEIPAVLALNWRLKATCLLILSGFLQLVSLQRRWNQRWSGTFKLYLRSCGMSSQETQFYIHIHIPKPTCKRLVSQCGSSYSVGLQDCCLVNANCKF